jgi:hypothetical protein
VFLSSWRQPLIERYNQVGPQRDIEHFAEPVRRFVAEFSALAGLGRISESYAAGVAAHLIPTMLAYTLRSAAMFTTETTNGRPPRRRSLGADAFDVMVGLAAGRSLGDGVAPDVSRLRDVFRIAARLTRRPSNGACCRCPGTGSRCERHLRRASTALPAMLDVIERCLSDRYESWSPKLKEMVPSLGTELSSESALFEQVWSWGTKVLELDKPANGMPPAPADSDVHSDAERLAVSDE